MVGGKGRQEPRGDDVVLLGGVAAGDERRCGSGQRHDHEHRRAEAGPPVAQQAGHDARGPRRIRGSIHATATSASRLPATTSTAVTTVAAMTTG